MIDEPVPLCFNYCNHRGVLERRRVHPLNVWYGVSPWYDDEAHNFLDAHDLDRNATRTSMMCKMLDQKEGE